MYQFAYTEIVEDSRAEMRARERDALDRIVTLLKAARNRGPQSQELVQALYYLKRHWTIFIADLQDDGNELPDQLRANLISIGAWTLKEIERIRTGAVTDLDAIIDINAIIRDSLK